MLFQTFIDLAKNEIRNYRKHNLASPPSGPVPGMEYWDTTLTYSRIYDGTAWQRSSFLSDPYNRSNHTGTQLAATISDFNTAVRTNRLDQLASPTAALGLNSQRVTSVADPTGAQDAATKNYVDTAIQAKSYKDAVRAATTAALPTNTFSGNVLTATSNGALPSQDGVALNVADRLLVKNETTGANNGIYTVTSVGGAGSQWSLTRALDADTSGEVLSGMTTIVNEGSTNANRQYTLNTPNPITLNTTALTFVQTSASGGGTYAAGNGMSLTGSTFSVNAANGIIADGTSTRVDPAVVARKSTGLIGDGSSTSIAYTHGLGNQYVTVQVYDASTNAQVFCDVTLTSTTVVTLGFATAPSASSYRVVVTG